MHVSWLRKKSKEFDMLTLGATALKMFTTGNDAVSISIYYAAYNLAIQTDIQDKLQREVDEAFDENGGMMPDYSAIAEMEYLDMIVRETLRYVS